jgi:hypothetical protein
LTSIKKPANPGGGLDRATLILCGAIGQAVGHKIDFAPFIDNTQ